MVKRLGWYGLLLCSGSGVVQAVLTCLRFFLAESNLQARTASTVANGPQSVNS
jgi:hypothetical protein